MENGKGFKMPFKITSTGAAKEPTPFDLKMTDEVTKPDQPQPENVTKFKVISTGAEKVAEEPSTFQEALRHGTRSAARFLESAIGTPGALVQLGQKGMEKLIGAVTGVDPGEARDPKIRERLEPQKRTELPTDKPFADVPTKLPTTEDVRDVTRHFTEEKLEPKSEVEEIGDEIAGDIGSAVSFLPTVFSTAAPAAKHLGGIALRSFLGTPAGRGVKKLTGSELAGDLTKLAFMTLPVRPGITKSIRENKPKLYEKAEKMAEGIKTPASPLETALEDADKILRKAPVKQKGQIKNLFKAIDQNINLDPGTGKRVITGTDAIELKKSLNSFFPELNQTPGGRKVYQTLSKALDKTFKGINQKSSGFLETFEKANASHAALETIESMQKTVKEASKKAGVKSALGTVMKMLGISKFGVPGYLAVKGGTAGIGSAIQGARSGAQRISEFMKRPPLRKEVADMFANAALNRVPATIKSIEKIAKIGKKIDKDLKD